VANQFTSVATKPGLSDALVQQAYDLAVSWVLREMPQYRSFVSKRPERPSMAGASIVLSLFDYFGDAAITQALTPLNEEQDIDSTKMPPLKTVTLTPNEYGFAVTRTKQLALKSFADVDQPIARAVAQHMGEVMDELVQNTLVTGTQILRPSARATTGAVTATDKLTAGLIRQAVTKLRVNKAVPTAGDLYLAGVHPHVLHDLREETGSGSWRLPTEYGSLDASLIKSGEIGEFEGVRFVANTRTRKAVDGASGATVYRSFIFGQEAVAEVNLEEPHTVLGPVVDKLNRFRTVGWTGTLGFGIYRQESLLRLETSSSVANL
jgi:N4-gp56 family major capsid protein